MTISDVDLAYAAGIVDGEGCVCLSLSRIGQLQATVSVRMTDQQVPRWFHETFGGRFYVQPEPGGRRKATAMWRVNSLDAARFCATMHPFLRVKGPQARLLVELYSDDRYTCRPGLRVSDEQRALRGEYAVRMSALNARGIQDARP